MSAHGFSDEDLERGRDTKLSDKTRPRGSLPYLPKTQDPLVLCEFVSLGLCPRPGWRVVEFARAGRQKQDPCSLTIRNGREAKTFRFSRQGELWGRDMRSTVIGVTDAELQPPHLTGGEIEDIWSALCTLGSVATDWDDRTETTKWVEQLLVVTMPLTGYTLVPDGRHDALMAIKAIGEFTRPDALAMLRPSDEKWQRRPLRVIDKDTGYQWLRAGETATYIRHVLGADPLAHSTLRARLSEIGVTAKLFEDYRPPHPKLTLYGLTEALVDSLRQDQ